MTKLFDQAIEKVIATAKKLPPEEQDNLANAIMYLVDDGDQPEEIDAEDLPDILEAIAEVERGEFATDEEVEAVFRSFGKKS